ncbi:MAG TPA: S53 family peptidase [Acidimicrobiia bacterium]|nr:S53 family peptidase [Acidimicrobiia bacterium]
MRKMLIVVMAAVLVAAAWSSASSASNRVAIRGSVPSWAQPGNRVGAVDQGTDLVVRVYLRGADPAGLEAIARAVSNPKSPSYRHYLTPAQVRARYAPSAATVATMRAWLQSVGLTILSVPANNAYVEAKGSPAHVAAAFDVSLSMYRVHGQLHRAADRDLSVPASIANSVLGVVGVDDALSMLQPKHIASDPNLPPSDGFRNARPCSAYWAEKLDTTDPAYGGGFPNPLPYAPCGYTPPQLRSAYGLASTVAAGHIGASATVAIIDAFASPTIYQDASEYAQRNDPNYPLGPAQFSQVIFPTNHQWQATTAAKCGATGWYGEETLDVEAVHAMAPGAHILYVGGSDCLDASLDKALNAVVANHWAQIVTNSYGDIGEGVPADEVAAFEGIAIQAASEGIGLYFSSGDDGDETDNLPSPSADFSASSPWVTAVGGTSTGIDASGSVVVETGWETGKSTLIGGVYTPPAPGAFLYGSGGGVSKLFAEPDYQQAVMPDATGRVVPDVAMDGDPNTGMLVGQTQKFPGGPEYDEYRIGGTSLSSPLFAGVMALADDLAGTAHGFVNPLLYSSVRTGGGFRDVVHENEAVARVDYVNSVDAKKGTITSVRTFDFGGLAISTGPGYDTTTGLGVPNGAAFLAHM